MSYKWTDEQVFKFVQLYEHYSCLWNTNDPEYKDRNARQAAIDEIIGQLDVPNLTTSDVKNKIKNLRSHYCQELKKVRESEKNGATGDAVHRPTVPWFDTLHGFLGDVVQHKSPSEPKTTPVSETLTRIRKQHTSSPIFKVEILDSTSDQSTFDAVPEVTPKKRRSNHNSRTSTSIDRSEHGPAVPFDSQRPTEFDVFGQSVAAQLNNMPFTAALELQLRIQQTITQHRLRLYNSNLRDSFDN